MSKELSPQLKEAFLDFATNFFNASSEDKAKLFREYNFSEKDIENASSEEERTRLQSFIELRRVFLRELSKPDFFVVNDTFLNEKFISELVNIDFRKTDMVGNIAFDAFVNAMVANFFIKGEKRNLTGRDVINLYNSVMMFSEDKFHKLTATKISSEIYSFFFQNTIKKDIIKTVLLNPFYPIILQHFIKTSGFTSIDEYKNKAMAVEHRKNINFETSNDEIYSKYQQTPLDRITLSSDCKAFSYEKEYRDRQKYGEHQSPDTLFFNCVLKDTELEGKYNINKQPNIFKLSDYVRAETDDNSYILEALNISQNLNTPLLPSQQTKALEKMQEQLAQMEMAQKRLRDEIKAQRATQNVKKPNKESETDDFYNLLVKFGETVTKIKEEEPRRFWSISGAVILLLILFFIKSCSFDEPRKKQNQQNTTNQEIKMTQKDKNGTN